MNNRAQLFHHTDVKYWLM